MEIACIVELANGMKSCRKARIPVVGIPLNANRCIHWMMGIMLIMIVPSGCRSFLKSPDEYIYPVKLSEGNRYLTDQKDKPFFWSGDAAWSIIVQLNREDVDYYLDDRKQKGFTVILVNLIDHKFGSNAPANIYNETPFKDKPFISPNENYFLHADDDNIIWCIGGDADPTPLKYKVIECVKGIQEYDNRHLFTCHNNPEFLAINPWAREKWLNINNVYSYSQSLYEMCKNAYDIKPVMPFFMIESAYENEHNSTPQQLRSEAYWPLLCGAMGHIFGNCPVWHFGSTPGWCGISDWKTQLNNPGSISMDHLQKLFRSRPWHLLIPDYDHKVITDGYGQWGSNDYLTAAIASDGTTVIAYIPDDRPVTVDLSRINGKKAHCWWYNPGNGTATDIGTIPDEGLGQFNPPSNGDWVLVIDATSSHYHLPGRDMRRKRVSDQPH